MGNGVDFLDYSAPVNGAFDRVSDGHAVIIDHQRSPAIALVSPVRLLEIGLAKHHRHNLAGHHFTAEISSDKIPQSVFHD